MLPTRVGSAELVKTNRVWQTICLSESAEEVSSPLLVRRLNPHYWTGSRAQHALQTSLGMAFRNGGQDL